METVDLDMELPPAPGTRVVRFSAGGGLEIVDDGEVAVWIRAEGRRWTVRAAGGESWSLRYESEPPGWTLAHRSGSTEARATLSAAGPDGGAATILTADGRLFRVVPRGGRDARFDLLGWEVPGAYLTARIEAGGWRLATTVAGAMMHPDPAIWVLFAVVVAGCGVDQDGVEPSASS